MRFRGNVVTVCRYGRNIQFCLNSFSIDAFERWMCSGMVEVTKMWFKEEKLHTSWWSISWKGLYGRFLHWDSWKFSRFKAIFSIVALKSLNCKSWFSSFSFSNSATDTTSLELVFSNSLLSTSLVTMLTSSLFCKIVKLFSGRVYGSFETTFTSGSGSVWVACVSLA